MARYASAASRLLVSSLTLSGPVWALETTEAQGSSIAATPNESNTAAEDSNAWSWPDAISKSIGHEPLTEWKEYLFVDPFGENNNQDDVGSSAAIIRTPKDNADQVNWKGASASIRGKWWPSITCPYGGAMQVETYGKEQCIGVGQGICKDGWQFGIRHHADNTYLMLWREDDPANPVYKWFPGATQLCIGEQYPNVAYLRVVYEDCLYYLIGPGAGDADNLARLKIVPDTQKYKPDDVIVKFRDGPGDDNTLWQIFANGFSKTSPDSLWYPLPCASESPSSNPTSSPSASPTSSPSSSPSSEPTAASCLPSPTMELEEEGGSITFTLTKMPMATFYVELRTFIRGDFNGRSEYADFLWFNSTSGQVSSPSIGRNDGGSPECSTFYLEETFAVPVETYNSWVEEGNGAISIVVDASSSVGIFCDGIFQGNDAYIQFQIDEDCGTFSVAPSSQPTLSSMPSISPAPSSKPSSIPSTTPSISMAPTALPSKTPSAAPSVSAVPTTACDSGANVGTFQELKRRISKSVISTTPALIKICPDKTIVFEDIIDFSEKHFKAECLGLNCLFDLDGFSFVTNKSGVNFTAEFQDITIENGSTEKGRDPDLYSIVWGGAFFLRGVSPAVSTLTLTNCTLQKNDAPSDSGVFDSIGATVIATNTIFSDNESGRDGGVAYTEGISRFENCLFERNRADDYGGAIISYDSTTSFHNCRFEGNSAGDIGGAISMFVDGYSVEDCHFEGNSAGDDGGGIYSSAENSNIKNCQFISNSAEDSGGAIASFNGDNITAVDSQFTDNGAAIGGAIYTTGIARFEDCLFEGNDAIDGGAIFSRRTTAVTGTQFKCNEASDLGGSIFHFGGDLTVSGAEIVGNTARGLGGGLYLGENTISTLDNCRFEQNNVRGIFNGNAFQGSGGGAIAYAQVFLPTAISTHTMNDTVFQNNTSGSTSSDDILNYDSLFNNKANTVSCGAGYGNCFCDANLNPLVAPNITTNDLPTTCSGAGVGLACPDCMPTAAPVVCPASVKTRGSTNAPMDIIYVMEETLNEKETEEREKRVKRKGKDDE
eukprot:CAMPEP_0181037090 /NCGR_PEP_ID=MMETSP1070-20121207/9213_1 /TAXON_ID=265543 /ORGANISM="Minutocellus polymorphus, Strain NH13" /LENGTH=1054 /DNA_ID=CAMNT_0023114777 /DNA_START=289 /DNA_END=3453 /DNA_ORIENTATION=-